MTEDAEPDPRAVRGSPLPGCIILASIVTVFGGLIVLYAGVYFYQNRIIGGFTSDAPAEIARILPGEEDIAEARAKLSAVESAAAGNRAERILFTARDLNVLIETLEAAEDFRGRTRIDRITGRGIVAEMAQPMRKGLRGVRYLNGIFVFEPQLRARTVAFKVLDIDPAEGEAPQGFVDNYAALDFFRLDPENEAIEAHIGALAAIYTEEGHLVVETGLRAAEP